ncbi:amino acid kinase family protein [Saccharothrix sp. Mg75]|uniref:amino acid kinase family protein n=1 Tax=Saccharothrix sp. Mg75 TaxID=3445357 RepID=UPI003EEBF487
MAPLIPEVLKFGGSAFVDSAGFDRVAEHVAHRAARCGRVVVVVSAMSGTTGLLQEALRRLNPDPPAGASAMVLTTGELVSTGLLVAALATRGVTATDLSGHRLGFLATGPADRAQLISVDPAGLRDALRRCPVVVVPGGQAVDAAGTLVMLGRNSSDLSAVAAATAVGAPSCEIFSDVPGVCTADPHLVPAARTLPVVGHDTMRLLAEAGAKVVQGQALRWARRHGIEVRCSTMPPAAVCGTVIAEAPPSAACVVHQRGRIWSFGTTADRDDARTALHEEGVETLTVGTSLLVVSPDGRDRATARHCAAGTAHPDSRLLTVLRSDGAVERIVVPQDEAVDALRRAHDRLYPQSAPRAPGPPSRSSAPTTADCSSVRTALPSRDRAEPSNGLPTPHRPHPVRAGRNGGGRPRTPSIRSKRAA